MVTRNHYKRIEACKTALIEYAEILKSRKKSHHFYFLFPLTLNNTNGIFRGKVCFQQI